MKLYQYIAFILSSAGAVAANLLGVPSQNYLGFMNLTLGEFMQVGDVGLGQQITIPISGGSVYGPKVNGTISNFGGDYGFVDSDGLYRPDARLNIQTYDGASIYMQLDGSELQDQDGQEDRLGVLRVKYLSGNANYTWLNRIAATAVYQIPGVAGQNKYLLVEMWETVYSHEGAM